jgi:hypothetical protein
VPRRRQAAPAGCASTKLAGFPSASSNAAAVAKRSAGSFSSARITTPSSCGGMVCRWSVSERGCSVITRAMIACAVGPMNGGSPVSIS